MISKSFNSRQQLEELSFKKHHKSVNIPIYKNLSTTQTADEEEDDQNESF